MFASHPAAGVLSLLTVLWHVQPLQVVDQGVSVRPGSLDFERNLLHFTSFNSAKSVVSIFYWSDLFN